MVSPQSFLHLTHSPTPTINHRLGSRPNHGQRGGTKGCVSAQRLAPCVGAVSRRRRRGSGSSLATPRGGPEPRSSFSPSPPSRRGHASSSTSSSPTGRETPFGSPDQLRIPSARRSSLDSHSIGIVCERPEC
ncbi:uncharacterized protein LOC122249447 isoform X1 [Penaeus japonicus]|uniref:uncharacterized protein LOC122249447 isoform X1 n=1 Tax=Penaeus japonicus TaxID=27405 RepID=UPI001C70D929|nr:uncharacterized protein LOC122249447 isoform X1 [Penaeus japonicus]